MPTTDNAIKYSKKRKKPQIEIGISTIGNFTRFTISDNGIGIKKAYQRKIFEPFYRIHSKDTKEIKGTGVGLSTAKKIIELHGGYIMVESKLNKYINFIFTIPMITKGA